MKKTTVPTEFLGHLSAATFDGNEMRLAGMLDRGIYQKLAKIIEAAGGKWNRKAAAHVFDGPAQDAIEPILLTGEIVRPADMGQFDSPPPVVDKVMELAQIEPGHMVLEPSAGTGNLVKAALDRGAHVRGVELDERRYDGLLGFSSDRFRVRRIDFLAMDPDAVRIRFDRVVMNPPFAPRQADIDHVLHAIRFLKPGGRLVSVMAAGVKFRRNRKVEDFRATLAANGPYYLHDLPEGSFKASGTAVNAVVVALEAAGA